MPNFEYENLLKSDGFTVVCGVDEAGRGPLAGPVYAAAVILKENEIIDSLNDSKKLSEKKREILYDVIIEKALCYSIATADVEEIEKYNILNATFMAMNRAIEGLDITPNIAIIDGNKSPKGCPIKTYPLVKGDQKSFSVSAASILAKVSRDRYMCSLDEEKYGMYNFSKHKGYGTKEHVELLKKYGVSDIHRKSFLKKILK